MARNQVQVPENINKSPEKSKSFEEDLTRLEEIVAVLESGEKTLAENLKLYEEGIRLSRSCHKKLDEVEGRLQILTATESATEPTAGSTARSTAAGSVDSSADNAHNNGVQGKIEIRVSDFELEERG